MEWRWRGGRRPDWPSGPHRSAEVARQAWARARRGPGRPQGARRGRAWAGRCAPRTPHPRTGLTAAGTASPSRRTPHPLTAVGSPTPTPVRPLPPDIERGPRAPGATRPGRPLLLCGFARPSWGATALTWASGPLCPAQGQTVAGGPTTSPDVGATGPPGGSGLWAGPWSLPFQCLLLLGQGQAALYPVTQPGVWACVACPGPGARPVALARGPDHSPLPAPAAGPDTLPASVRGYSRSWWPPSGP